jgi:uncharacterized membrane protein
MQQKRRDRRSIMTHADLQAVRAQAAARRAAAPSSTTAAPSFPDRCADLVAQTVGSWRFILIQSGLLIGWIVFNVASSSRVDPYPFILLNLLLSFQAAYTAPIIMMSQNRLSDSDRTRAIADFEINTKAELEIETLHHKLDLLREQERAALAAAVDRLTRLLEARGAPNSASD